MLPQSSQICLSSQEMSSAVITYCGHFFHGNCLRKWLYVQETCPMCHQTIRPTPPGQSQASGDTPAAPTQRDPAAREGDQNQDNGTPEETQSEAATPDPTEQQEETESFGDGDCRTEDKDQPAEPQGDAAQGLRFSSSGDFVGFVSPVSSCSSGGISNSHVLLSKTPPNMNNQGEGSGRVSRLPLTPNAVNENTVEGQSDSNGAEFEVTLCPRVPQSSDGDHDSCEGTPKSWNSLESPESNNADSSPEASGINLVDSQTFVRSSHENSELLDCIDVPQTRKDNGTYSDLDLDRLREAETVPLMPPSLAQAQTNSD